MTDDIRDADAERALQGQGALPEETLVLHEQRLVAGTERVETARGVVRTRVVTETVQVPVQVQREELVIEGLDGKDIEVLDSPSSAAVGSAEASAADADPSGRIQRDPGTGEELARIVLHAQRPVVTLETVAVEEVVVRRVVTRREVQVTERVEREEVELTTEGDVQVR